MTKEDYDRWLESLSPLDRIILRLKADADAYRASIKGQVRSPD